MSAGDSSTSPGGIVAGVSIAVGAFLLVLAFMCSLCQGYRTSRGNGPAATAAAAAVRAAHPLEPPAAWYWDDDGRQEARARSSAAREEEHRRPQGPQQQPRASPSTADLPSFTYTPSSAKRNVTGGGGEEGMCSVCLGAFQAGETVRLLPVCLHLYHVECIDPWLNAHSTCPICRSGTDPTVDGGLLPPV